MNKPFIPVEIPVADGFSGRVIVYMESGKVMNSNPLLDNEILLTLQGFIQLARKYGWQVIPLAQNGGAS
ncbi:hypothetical protein [Serratia liquefaciens]|uniref:hypothetical protein n=1 Tax=Serratia liquefaciens TaxID=614 RepID=UPI00390596CF